MFRVSPQKCPFVEKWPPTYIPTYSCKMQKLGVFCNIQDICYQMGTDIFKIEEKMTEKKKPKVGNPP